jgi:glucosamine--fructose-6-phosphate aminotransferase (isomerizing)
MAREIREQPEVLSRLFSQGRGRVLDAVDRIRAQSPRFVLLAARGTSDHAALYAKYLIEVGLGIPCGLASPSTVTLYEASARTASDVLVISVSQSGGSPDLVAFTEAWAQAGATCIAVVNNLDSPLAAASQACVDVMAGEERAVAATKSFTAELMALWMLVRGWRGADLDAAADVPGQAELLASNPALVEPLADRYRFTDRIVVTARGYSYPVAREGALKLMETSYVAAHAFSAADLLHGPVAAIDSQTPVLAVAPSGLGSASMREAMLTLRARSVDVVSIGDGLGDAASFALPLPGVPEDLAPILATVPLQWLAWHLAVDRGHDPDRPRALAKVTQTR